MVDYVLHVIWRCTFMCTVNVINETVTSIHFECVELVLDVKLREYLAL